MVDEWHLIDHLLPAHLHWFSEAALMGITLYQVGDTRNILTWVLELCKSDPWNRFLASEQPLSVTLDWSVSQRMSRICFISPTFPQRSTGHTYPKAPYYSQVSRELFQPPFKVHKQRQRFGVTHPFSYFHICKSAGCFHRLPPPFWIPRTLGATEMLIRLLIYSFICCHQ